MNPYKLKATSLCIHPWSHLAINPNGDVVPCCHQRGANPTILGNVKEKTIDEIFNGDKMKKLRVDMLNGILPEDTCHKCVNYEKIGVKSPRQWAFTHHYADEVMDIIPTTQEDGTLPDFKIRYWDLRFSNICNMTCVMCTPQFSSRWTIEANRLYKSMTSDNARSQLMQTLVLSEEDTIAMDKVENFGEKISWVDDAIHDVEKIYFAGGEPLVMDEHWYILEKLDNLKKYNVKMKYNSNLLKLDYKGKNVIDYWKKWKKDSLYIENSVDELGARAEWIRYGTDWKIVSSNIRKLVEADIRCSPIISLGCYNIFRLPEMLEEFKELYRSDNERFTPALNPVFTKAFNIQVLPDKFKKEIRKKIKRYEKSTGVHNPQNLKTFYNELEKPHSEQGARNFLKKSAVLDFSRDTNVFEAIPELDILNKEYPGIYDNAYNLISEHSNLKKS